MYNRSLNDSLNILKSDATIFWKFIGTNFLSQILYTYGL